MSNGVTQDTLRHEGERSTRRQFVQRGVSAGAALAFAGTLPGYARGMGSEAVTAGSEAVKRGGRLRVATAGNGNLETLVPYKANSITDLSRTVQIFERLTHYDEKGHAANLLAEEMTPNGDATVWTIRVLPDVEFHNGKTLTADDVIFTLQANILKKNGSFGGGAVAGIVPGSFKKLDKRTFRLQLKTPNAYLPDLLTDFHLGIFPAGTTTFDQPVGTGAFQFESWVRGERVSLNAFKQYRKHGGPYVDALEMISVPDAQARLNALLSHQVDLIADVPAAQAARLKSGSKGLRLLETESAQFIASYMFCSGKGAAPFNDARVRQALRLLVDRDQVVSNAFGGYAKVGNDLTSWPDPSYPRNLTQRKYDPGKAKALLKAAGRENLEVTMYISPFLAGLVPYAELFAQQAKAGGVTIRLNNSPPGEYFAKYWTKQPFGTTTFAGRSYVHQAVVSLVRGASLNETRWNDPEWNRVFNQALSTRNKAKSKELLAESERILNERGGYIIPAFPSLLDGGSTKVKGTKKNPMYNLGYFDFRDTYIA